MLLIAFAVAHLVPEMRAKRQRASSVPVPVFVCLAALAALPFAGFVVGKFVSNVLEPRYVLPCALGLLVLASLAIRDIARQHAAGVIASTLIVGGYAFLYYYSGLSSVPAPGDAATFADASVLSATPELPVVPADYDLFLRLKAHGAASMRDRCVLPKSAFDPFTPPKYGVFDGRCSPVLDQAPDLDLASSFLRLRPRFYLIERPEVQGWLIQYLLENSHLRSAVFRGTYGGNPVYLVHVPG